MKTLYYYGVFHALRKKSDNFKDFFCNQNPSYSDIQYYVEKTIETMGLKPYETYKVDYEDGDPNPPKRTAIRVFVEIIMKIFDETNFWDQIPKKYIEYEKERWSQLPYQRMRIEMLKLDKGSLPEKKFVNAVLSMKKT